MQELKDWCMGLCCAAVFCSAVLLAAPDKKIASMMKFLCTILLSVAFILPFAGVADDLLSFKGLDFGAVSYNSSYEGYRSGMEYTILTKLKNAGFEPSKVEVSDSGGSTAVTVYLPQSMRGAVYTVRSIIYDSYGFETEFVFTE